MKRVAVLFWLLSMSAAITDRCPAAATSPNVIFIMADDLGAARSRLLRQHVPPDAEPRPAGGAGVKFTQAYAANPLCSPTRSSVLTGLWPARTGSPRPPATCRRCSLEKQLAKGNPNTTVLVAAA